MDRKTGVNKGRWLGRQDHEDECEYREGSWADRCEHREGRLDPGSV